MVHTSGMLAASSSVETRATVAKLFDRTLLVACQTDDLTGAILAAALKNIYTLGLGICDGLKMGSNIHGALVAQATREMMRIETVGGKPETALGLAG